MKGKGMTKIMKYQNNCLQMSDQSGSQGMESLEEQAEELSEEQAFRPARNTNVRLSWRHHYQADISYASKVRITEMRLLEKQNTNGGKPSVTASMKRGDDKW